MCPLCISTLAWAVAGVGSAGGVTALVVKKFRASDATTQPDVDASSSTPERQKDEA
jgi:hypothetical protein